MLVAPAIRNEVESQMMNFALMEAEFPGRSIIWDKSQTYTSLQTSLMSVQLDPTTWLEPDMDNLFIIMFQQLSIHDSTQPWIASCGFLRSRNFGNGRIVEINSGLVINC